MKHYKDTQPKFSGAFFGIIFSGILLLSAHNVKALTFVLDFTSLNTTETFFQDNVTTDAFDPTAFNGFVAADFNSITSTVLSGVINDFTAFPTIGTDPQSTLAVGQELDIDFEIGTVSGTPVNGDNDYYFMKVGEQSSTGITFLGHACLGCVRGVNFMRPAGTLVGSILTDVIATAFSTNTYTSGDLTEVANLLIGTISHEIGHTLSLGHSGGVFNPGDSVFSLMGTGGFGMPNDQRILDRAFSYDEFSTLINLVGTRDIIIPPASVPLPASVYLFGFSMALLGFMQRRKKAA